MALLYRSVHSVVRVLILLLLLLMWQQSPIIASTSETATAPTDTVVVMGKIESCSGCSLNRLPELKSFLMDGEAESYRGLEITFIHGREAILTIYHNGVMHEHIKLSELKTKDEMHAMMKAKGFQKKNEEEMQAWHDEQRLKIAKAELAEWSSNLYYKKRNSRVKEFEELIMNPALQAAAKKKNIVLYPVCPFGYSAMHYHRSNYDTIFGNATTDMRPSNLIRLADEYLAATR